MLDTFFNPSKTTTTPTDDQAFATVTTRNNLCNRALSILGNASDPRHTELLGTLSKAFQFEPNEVNSGVETANVDTGSTEAVQLADVIELIGEVKSCLTNLINALPAKPIGNTGKE